MYEMYMVMTNLGFGITKYFHEFQNAKAFADSVGESVDTEKCTANEYFGDLKFEDATSDWYKETPRVQFNMIN